MRKVTRNLLIVALAVAGVFSSLAFFSTPARGSDHVGYKKIFLRNHCKCNSEYVCHLSGWPTGKM